MSSTFELQTSLATAARTWQPMLRTGTSLDELQKVVLRWCLAKRKDTITYYAPTQQIIFAWGYVSGLAVTIQKNHITPNLINPEKPDYFEGLHLRHSDGDLIILTTHNNHAGQPGNIDTIHTQSPKPEE